MIYFSSPGLKAQVSFSDRLSSVCLYVCLFVCPSVHLSVNFLLFHLFPNYLAYFNQT